jgi:hypothetical protein
MNVSDKLAVTVQYDDEVETYEEPAKHGSSAVFFMPLAKKIGDSDVKFSGPCKPNSNIWSMVMTVLVDGAGVHEDSAHCRGSKLGGTAGKNVIGNTLNFLLHSLSPLLSFVPPSGIKLDLNAYVNDPTSHQPTKKAHCGDQILLVTAARSTSTSASPPKNSMYTYKRAAISYPAKGAMASSVSYDSSRRSNHSVLPPSTLHIQPGVDRKIAFDNALGKNELQQAANDAAWRSLMAPHDQLVEEEWKADAVKKDTCLSRIYLLREQFAEAACQKGIDSLTPPSHSNNGTKVNEIEDGRIYGKEYDNDDKDFSYHSSDGSAEEEAAVHRELGHGTVGTSPMATLGSKEGSTHNSGQMENTPNWLHEINNNQMFGKADLISVPINQFFFCIVCNNHKNINDLSAWLPIFLLKSGVATWELFDVDFADVCNKFVWDSDGGLGNMWVKYYKCPDIEYIQCILMSQKDAAVWEGFAGTLRNAYAGLSVEATIIPQALDDATATATMVSSSISSSTPGTPTSCVTQASSKHSDELQAVLDKALGGYFVSIMDGSCLW